MGKTEDHAERIMSFLEKNKGNRGVMADLRCGFSTAREHRAWPHIAPYCDLDKEWSRIPVQTVCAAFATQPGMTEYGNIGTTLRKIAQGQGSDGLASFEGRFRRLLTSNDKLELCDLIPSVIRAAKSKDVPVNYHRLYCDICWWGQDKKVDWAAEYWGEKPNRTTKDQEGGHE